MFNTLCTYSTTLYIYLNSLKQVQLITAFLYLHIFNTFFQHYKMHQNHSIMLHVYQKCSCVPCVESRWCTEAYTVLFTRSKLLPAQDWTAVQQSVQTVHHKITADAFKVIVSYMQIKATHSKYILLFGAAVWLTATSINGVTGFSGWSVPGIRVKAPLVHAKNTVCVLIAALVSMYCTVSVLWDAEVHSWHSRFKSVLTLQ